MEAVERLPSSPETMVLALQLRLDLWWPLGAIGSFTQQFQVLAEAEQLATALGDQRQQARVRAMQASSLRNMGRSDEALAAGQQALKLAEASGDRPVYTFAMHELGRSTAVAGSFDRPPTRCASASTPRALTRVSKPFMPDRPSGQVARAILVWTLGELGDFEEAIEQGKIGIQSCEQLGDPSSILLVWNTLARTYLERGDLANALPLLIPGLERVRTIDDTGRLGWSLATRGVAYTLSGSRRWRSPSCARRWRSRSAPLPEAARSGWSGSPRRTWRPARLTMPSARSRAPSPTPPPSGSELNLAYALRAHGEIAASGDAPAS